MYFHTWRNLQCVECVQSHLSLYVDGEEDRFNLLRLNRNFITTFNVQCLCILTIECTCLFHIIFRINSDYFLRQC
jgi:hypothetical protein